MYALYGWMDGYPYKTDGRGRAVSQPVPYSPGSERSNRNIPNAEGPNTVPDANMMLAVPDASW